MAATKQYRLKIQERGAYVFACVDSKDRDVGPKDPTYLDRIADHCAACRCSLILIEKHTPETFEVWDAFLIAPKLADIGHPHVRVAIVEKGAEPPQQKKLAVAIGRERSLAVRVFSESGPAKEWLLTGEMPMHAFH